MLKVFKYIFYPIILIVRHLYYSYNWLIDNTIGLIFTTQYTRYNSLNNSDNKNLRIAKRIINMIVLLVLIFSFQFIYQNTIGILIRHLLTLIGKFFSLSIFGSLFSNFSKILINFAFQYSDGIGQTLYLSLIGTTVGLLIALVFSYIVMMHLSERDNKLKTFIKKLYKRLVNAYVTIVRGTPMMVQAMLIYWGTISFIPWDYKIAGLVVVSLNTTAYLTEVLRGGFEATDKGQREGALSLGLSEVQTMLYVTFPQALKNSMAAIGNEFVINIKDTAVLSVILVVDIFRVSEAAAGFYLDSFTPFIIAALIYLCLTYSITKLLRYLEKRLELPGRPLPSSN